MMLRIDDAILLYSDQVWQPISPDDINLLWSQVEQQYSEPAMRWSTYCHALCLKTFLNWVAEEIEVEALPQPDHWLTQVVSVLALSHERLNQTYQTLQRQRFVSYLFDQTWQEATAAHTPLNGIRVTMWGKRLALIPCEAIDPDEVCIPQAWVDVPELAADYYLAIALDLDEQWLRVYGYLSHAQVQQKGTYQAQLGVYSVAEADLQSRSFPWLTTYFTALATEAARTDIAELETSSAIASWEDWGTWVQEWCRFGSQISQGIQAMTRMAPAMARGDRNTLLPREHHLILGDYIVALRVSQTPSDFNADEIELAITARVVQGPLPLPENLKVILEFHDETGSSESLEEAISMNAEMPMIEFPELLGVAGAELSITVTLADDRTTQLIQL